MSVPIILTIVISLAVAWMVLSPFFLDFQTGLTHTDKDESLIDQKERCMRLLKDIELDFQTGKLSEEEFESIKNAQYLELAEILRKLS